MNVMLGVAVSGTPTLNITTNHTAMEAEVEVTMFVADGNGREDVAFVLDFVSMDLPTNYVVIYWMFVFLCSMHRLTWYLSLEMKQTIYVATYPMQS